MLREVVDVTELYEPVRSAVYEINQDMEQGQNSYFEWYDEWEEVDFFGEDVIPEHYKIVGEWLRANNKPADTLFLVWW